MDTLDLRPPSAFLAMAPSNSHDYHPTILARQPGILDRILEDIGLYVRTFSSAIRDCQTINGSVPKYSLVLDNVQTQINHRASDCVAQLARRVVQKAASDRRLLLPRRLLARVSQTTESKLSRQCHISKKSHISTKVELDADQAKCATLEVETGRPLLLSSHSGSESQ